MKIIKISQGTLSSGDRTEMKFSNKVSLNVFPGEQNQDKILDYDDSINIPFIIDIKYTKSGIDNITLYPYGVVNFTISINDMYNEHNKTEKNISLDLSKLVVFDQPKDNGQMTIGDLHVSLDNDFNVNYNKSYIYKLV